MKDKNGVEIHKGDIVKLITGKYMQVFKAVDGELVILDFTRNCHKIDGYYHSVMGKFMAIDKFNTSDWEVINP